MKNLIKSLFAVLIITLSPSLFADDLDDVMDVVVAYGELEGDLVAQSELMHPDRVWIAGGLRTTDHSKNMQRQIATAEAQEALNGGKTVFITFIEDVDISIHGNVAIASFVRWWSTYPANQAPAPRAPATWVSLVLVKEDSKWLIKHTHQSPVTG
ncbi:MAG: nuclear transport factor 2 family protein [Proteobacteria bacterium]|nr:nuclear transport factor 2 family protein [Pseudomonadota bacterium]